MPITQVSVSVENKPGTLHRLCDILEVEKINIKGVMASAVLAPVQVHLIVDDPDRTVKVLTGKGYTVETKEVIAVATPDHPGGLNAVLRPLVQAGINVETLYPFIGLNGGDPIIILEVDRVRDAKDVLAKHWVKTYSTEIYNS